MSGMLMPDQVRQCPRCFALILDQDTDWAKHMDWHEGVRDGFHEFVPGSSRFHSALTETRCAGEQRNSAGGAFWYCDLPPEHWYHQPLPDTAQS